MQARTICLRASQIAKGGGTSFGSGMTPIAGEGLNLVLEDLKLNKDLKVNRVTTTASITAGSYGPYYLPGDFLRTYDMFYPLPTVGGSTDSSMTQFLSQITMEQFDAEFKSDSISNYPYCFATDLSTEAAARATAAVVLSTGVATATSAGEYFIYPQTSGVITLTHRYMKNQPDIVSPQTSEEVPWFPFTLYLQKAVAAYVMGITGDERQSAFLAEANEMLRPHLIMQGDEQKTVQAITLDPRQFRFQKGLKPTKAAPY